MLDQLRRFTKQFQRGSTWNPRYTSTVDQRGVRRGRWIWRNTSKYKPHQGKRECQRRRMGGFAGSGGL